MKFIFICLFILSASVLLADNAPSFLNNLPRFTVENPSVTWNVVNQLPPELWTYQIAPQTFSKKAISALLKQTSFTNKITSDVTRTMILTNAESCFLGIYPAQGYIKYENYYAAANHWDKTNHLWEQVHNVPNRAEAEKLGLKLLKQFGIKREDLAQTPGGKLITFGDKKTRSYFDRRTQTNVDDEITTLGVYFDRRIDGINLAGIGLSGGCLITFGNNDKLSEFQLNWRNLQRFEHYKAACSNELVQLILDGKALMPRENFVNPARVKAITIKNITVLYSADESGESQEYMFPFGRVDMSVNLGTTNQDIQLFCPILTETKL